MVLKQLILLVFLLVNQVISGSGFTVVLYLVILPVLLLVYLLMSLLTTILEYMLGGGGDNGIGVIICVRMITKQSGCVDSQRSASLGS